MEKQPDDDPFAQEFGRSAQKQFPLGAKQSRSRQNARRKDFAWRFYVHGRLSFQLMATTGTVILVLVNLASALRAPGQIFIFDNVHVVRRDSGI